MAIMDTVAIALVSGLIFYNIKRTDYVDSRLDSINDRLARIEFALPKRKDDVNNGHFYSENSGIDL